MFEQLDSDAMLVVQVGINEAHRFHNGYLGTEHLLLGAISHLEVLPAAARQEMPRDLGQARHRVERMLTIGRGIPSDTVLLASLGIDVGEVRRRATETFGSDAVRRASLRVGARRRRRARSIHGVRRRGCFPLLTGDGLGVMPRVKLALERAVKEAHALGLTLVTPALLLAGILEDHEAMAHELLRELGSDPARVRAALLPDPG